MSVRRYSTGKRFSRSRDAFVSKRVCLRCLLQAKRGMVRRASPTSFSFVIFYQAWNRCLERTRYHTQKPLPTGAAQLHRSVRGVHRGDRKGAQFSLLFPKNRRIRYSWISLTIRAPSFGARMGTGILSTGFLMWSERSASSHPHHFRCTFSTLRPG